MDAPARPKILYLLGVGLLLTFDLLACGYSQGTGDVWFSLRSKTYQNNSLVTLDDIGEDDNALLCKTNLTACCRRPYMSALGKWLFPNKSIVPSFNKSSDFYRDRGEMVVRLKRRRGGMDGIYSCEIPDSLNVTQTIHIGVYNASTGLPKVTSLTFDDKFRTLTCTSTGGPAGKVTWRRDGVVITLNATYQQTKRLVDAVNGTYQTVLTINSSVGQIAGTYYNCTVENDRGESSETVTVTGAGDVWFSLNGTTYKNNSLVTLEDIGDNDDTALLCVTNLSACCRRNGGTEFTLGSWIFPNRTPVASSGEQWDFHRTRGQMVVLLHRRRNGEEGIYRCEIPDSMNVTQTIYIGVYNTTSGSPNVTSLTFDDQFRTLTCTSTGGPATNVTWRRDGVVITLNATHQQTKRLVDPVNSTYQTVLTIDPSVGQSAGTYYNCTVENDRGESSETVTVTGAGDVWFSLNGTTYQNNSCVTLEDIGKDGYALLCVTNLNACCRPPYTGETELVLGSWFFPNGTRVPSTAASSDFYRERGHMVVNLNRRGGGEEGIYRCKIPDSMNVTQNIYIEVYTANNKTVLTPTICQTDGTITATVSSIQPTNNPPSDGTTTTPVIIVVVIILVIVVGVVTLVVLFMAKKRKQRLEINKSVNVTTQNQDIEMKLKQVGNIEKETSSSVYQPAYAEIQKKAAPDVPSKSKELLKYLNQNSTVTGGYSEIELQADSKHSFPSKPPRHVSLLRPNFEEKEPSPMHQHIDQRHDLPNTTNVPKENDIYTEPDIASSHTVDRDSGIGEAVYSEPIQPSLFTDSVETASDCEALQPYAPIYTVPINLPKSEKMLLRVLGSNIREIRELGMGQFGKVILAETVGLSAKELRLSESDDDKSKSTLVALKKLKSGAPNATKEAFDKEVNFISRLTDKNVIRILGVCYEDTPFIMMEYMAKGDLNQYLQKFKMLSTTDSEPQGQITTSTLVHITTQIASAMKYLASHNFVHRDLATRNCLVGPNYLVKISDFGMSRSLYDSHYYCIHGRFALPVRWMAFECFYGKFSQKSDVWAFGVTMWEIFTLAKEQPYNDMSHQQVVENALKGKNRKILVKPDMCPLEVYKIMLECWAHNSEQRATFEELIRLLAFIHSNV